MPVNANASVEISIALLSWVNDQLKETAMEHEERRVIRKAYWIQQAVTVLSLGLSGLCVLALHQWS